MTEYAAGTPSWVDLSTSDADASKAFYGALFGWSTTEPREEFGGYVNFLDDGKTVGGLNPMGEQPFWSTYVSVDDAEATTAVAKEHGGSAIVEPMDVGDLGRMAVLVDPQGAVFGLWQPKEMRGAEKVNEANALCWNELHTPDIDAAKSFYGTVFGWRPEGMDMGAMEYTIFNVGDRGIGGGMPIGSDAPADMPPHWLVWFAVADRDATVAKARELGASVMLEAMDAPGVGKMAVLGDPQGAAFGVITPEMPEE
jgi:predicted enzyme related to lactoylglutathione lyase